jgi:succinyl-diaminopimelate desuccinylase
VPDLDLAADVVTLTAALCDIASVSRDEDAVATAIDAALRPLGHLTVTRHGNTVVARTELGRAERVVLAGHIDTVPLTVPPNLPTQRVGDELVGRGTVDMKGGVAVQLKLAHQVPEPSRDATYVFYEGEEIDGEFNGLAHLVRDRPQILDADFAVLLEPTNGAVEGGCKGTLRAEIVTKGIAAHSARPWNGHNAIHDAEQVLHRLTAYEARTVTVDGLDYHEALQAVGIQGGIAGNVIPDRAVAHVNFRYAPGTSAEEAEALLRGWCEPYGSIEIESNAPSAPVATRNDLVQRLIAAGDLEVAPKQAWTPVAEFAAIGVDAVNFGPGDPRYAHTRDEQVAVEALVRSYETLERFACG